MRLAFTSRDPMVHTRVLRLELGLGAELDEREPLTAAALARIDGETTMELLGMAAARRAPLVIMNLTAPLDLSQPARMMVFEPVGAGATVRVGWTLWAPTDPSRPLLLCANDGSRAERVTINGLVPLTRLPLGLEATAAAGIDRAASRISDRLLTTDDLEFMLVAA